MSSKYDGVRVALEWQKQRRFTAIKALRTADERLSVVVNAAGIPEISKKARVAVRRIALLLRTMGSDRSRRAVTKRAGSGIIQDQYMMDIGAALMDASDINENEHYPTFRRALMRTNQRDLLRHVTHAAKWFSDPIMQKMVESVRDMGATGEPELFPYLSDDEIGHWIDLVVQGEADIEPPDNEIDDESKVYRHPPGFIPPRQQLARRKRAQSPVARMSYSDFNEDYMGRIDFDDLTLDESQKTRLISKVKNSIQLFSQIEPVKFVELEDFDPENIRFIFRATSEDDSIFSLFQFIQKSLNSGTCRSTCRSTCRLDVTSFVD